MKPSEVLIGNMILEYCNSDDEYYLCENTSTNITTQIKALDKRFIDKEELKEKINKQIKEVKKVRDYPYSYKFLDTNQKKNLELECKYKIEAKKEILELIDK